MMNRHTFSDLPDNPTTQQYVDALRSHDIFHEMSDDHRHYTAGRDAEHRLRRIAHDNPDLQPLFEAMCRYRHTVIRPETAPEPLTYVEYQTILDNATPAKETSR